MIFNSNNRLSLSENLVKQEVIKYCEKEEKLLLSNFSFPQYFHYISNFRSQISYSSVECECSIYFFLNSANLICRGTDISKYLRESLGLRDNESRLYFKFQMFIHTRHLFDNQVNV